MSRQRSRDTEAELQLRRALYALGYRYRIDMPIAGLPRRRADLTFTRRKVVVFVDGCFWHACPQHATHPKRNSDWWSAKLQRNIERDRETDAHLRRMGWRVIRIWEHEPLDAAVAAVTRALEAT